MQTRISRATTADHAAIWAILKPVFRAGDSYTIDPAISREDALAYWTGGGREVWVARRGDEILGTYYIRPNAGGGGAHVCNCGFVTSPAARGLGLARAMLDHALIRAREKGFRAMQFNFVVATNTRAIDIWERAGFRTLCRLPGAFQHPREGYVDALVMWRDLEP